MLTTVTVTVEVDTNPSKNKMIHYIKCRMTKLSITFGLCITSVFLGHKDVSLINAHHVVLCHTETQRDIHRRATDELADAGLEGLHLRCLETSTSTCILFPAFFFHFCYLK